MFEKMESEIPLKRIRFTEAILNPFVRLPVSINQLVLHHLTGTEILECSEVSPKWNDLISKSPPAMSKIKLSLRESISKPEDVVPLDQKRFYRNMSLRFYHSFDADEKLSLLARNAFSVVDLELQIHSNGLIEALPDGLIFPRLESLTINHAEQLIAKCFKNVKTLKKLSLPIQRGNHIREELTFFPWLCQQRDLEDLELVCHRDYTFFLDILKEAPFKLTSLIWHCFETKMGAEERKNFNKFLMKMSETLTKLELATFFPADVELICSNKFPALTTLTLGNMQGNIDEIKLHRNKTIKTLKVASNFWVSRTPDLPKRLLLSLVNLEVLQLNLVRIEDLVWIVKHMKKLKTLIYFEHFTGSLPLIEIRCLYQRLKYSTLNRVNRFINIMQI